MTARWWRWRAPVSIGGRSMRCWRTTSSWWSATRITSWAMLRALVEGTQSPAEMAQLARGRMRRKLSALERALNGRLEDHHRFLLGVQMRRIEATEADLAELDRRLREKLAPYSWQMRLLLQIPGVDWVTAATII